MAKLNQIIAIEKGVKSRAHAKESELYKQIQKDQLFSGFSKHYEPLNDEGEKLPAEQMRVQYKADETLEEFCTAIGELMNVTARKDWSNCTAKADVKVDGLVLLKDVPVTYLLFLEKELTEKVRAFIGKLPTLSLDETWTKDENKDLYVTKEFETHRTKKEYRVITKYEATKEHPAQTELVTEDRLVGYWKQTKFSSALPVPRKQELVERVEKLIQAVKEAREAANAIDEVQSENVERAVFGYILYDKMENKQ